MLSAFFPRRLLAPALGLIAAPLALAACSGDPKPPGPVLSGVFAAEEFGACAYLDTETDGQVPLALRLEQGMAGPLFSNDHGGSTVPGAIGVIELWDHTGRRLRPVGERIAHEGDYLTITLSEERSARPYCGDAAWLIESIDHIEPRSGLTAPASD
jgi:hypothetical protein